MGVDIQYPDHYVDRLQILWGDGFLAPGGPQEVREITRDIDLVGKRVLDIGCGTGGPSILLAREMGVTGVVAVDVEPHLLGHAVKNAEKAGVGNKIEFRLVEAGPLPFEDNRFDVVFSKDALVHIADKEELFREVLRVLRPGGEFVASDWLGGANTTTAPEWARLCEVNELTFIMATASETEAAMTAVGFKSVSTRDRNDWYAELSRDEVEQVTGPLQDQLIEAVGEDIYLHWVKVRRSVADAVAVGALRPTHLRGHKSLS